MIWWIRHRCLWHLFHIFRPSIQRLWECSCPGRADGRRHPKSHDAATFKSLSPARDHVRSRAMPRPSADLVVSHHCWPRQSPFPHYGMESLVQFLQCDFEVFKGVPVIIWTGLLRCGIQPMKREAGMKCLEKLVWTLPCIRVCPGNATLALTRLHKHVQYATPIQFAPYINMGVAFTKTNRTNFPNLHTPNTWRSARAWKNKFIKQVFCWLISAPFLLAAIFGCMGKTHRTLRLFFGLQYLHVTFWCLPLFFFNPAYNPALLKNRR